MRYILVVVILCIGISACSKANQTQDFASLLDRHRQQTQALLTQFMPPMWDQGKTHIKVIGSGSWGEQRGQVDLAIMRDYEPNLTQEHRNGEVMILQAGLDHMLTSLYQMQMVYNMSGLRIYPIMTGGNIDLTQSLRSLDSAHIYDGRYHIADTAHTQTFWWLTYTDRLSNIRDLLYQPGLWTITAQQAGSSSARYKLNLNKEVLIKSILKLYEEDAWIQQVQKDYLIQKSLQDIIVTGNLYQESGHVVWDIQGTYGSAYQFHIILDDDTWDINISDHAHLGSKRHIICNKQARCEINIAQGSMQILKASLEQNIHATEHEYQMNTYTTRSSPNLSLGLHITASGQVSNKDMETRILPKN